jgi:signal transduction histidine kinase
MQLKHSQTLDHSVQSLWFDKQGRDVTDQIALLPAGISQTSSFPIQRIILPLQTRQRLVGSLLLETSFEGPFLSSLEAPTIIVLARQLAIAIENAQLVLQLREREARRAELLQRATNAQEAERKRVARELHDETGQALTALAVGLRGMSKLVKRDPHVASEQIHQLEVISTTALEELRHLISDLRPSHLDDLGLVAAIRWYTEQVARRSSLKVTFNTNGTACRLLPELETTLFRITQESLTYAMKHAGAEYAHITLDYGPHSVELCIADDGHGFDTSTVLRPGARRAWGLIGIQERAELAGGSVHIESSPGHGTTIIVSIPISESAAEERAATP